MDVDVALCCFELIVDDGAVGLRAELEGQMREAGHSVDRVQDGLDMVVEGEDGGVGEVGEVGEESGVGGGEEVLGWSWRGGCRESPWRPRLPVEGCEKGGGLAEEVFVLRVGF